MILKAEKEIAKARMDVAREIRLAKQAEAEMDLHVANAGKRVEQEISKRTANNPELLQEANLMNESAKAGEATVPTYRN